MLYLTPISFALIEDPVPSLCYNLVFSRIIPNLAIMSDSTVPLKRQRYTHTSYEAPSSDEDNIQYETAQTVRHYGSSTQSGRARTWGGLVNVPLMPSTGTVEPTDAPRVGAISSHQVTVDGEPVLQSIDEDNMMDHLSQDLNDDGDQNEKQPRILRPSVCVSMFTW